MIWMKKFEYTANYVKKLITPNIAKRKSNSIKSMIIWAAFLIIILTTIVDVETSGDVVAFSIFLLLLIYVIVKNIVRIIRLRLLEKIYNDIRVQGHYEFKELAKKYSLSYNSIRSIIIMGLTSPELQGFALYGDAVMSVFYKEKMENENKVENTTIAFIKCNNCGASLSSKDKVCPYCGTKLK